MSEGLYQAQIHTWLHQQLLFTKQILVGIDRFTWWSGATIEG